MSLNERKPTRSEIARNRRRTKFIGWAIIILILGAAGMVLWNQFAAVGGWELIPLAAAILIGWIIYKRALWARNH